MPKALYISSRPYSSPCEYQELNNQLKELRLELLLLDCPNKLTSVDPYGIGSDLGIEELPMMGSPFVYLTTNNTSPRLSISEKDFSSYEMVIARKPNLFTKVSPNEALTYFEKARDYLADETFTAKDILAQLDSWTTSAQLFRFAVIDIGLEGVLPTKNNVLEGLLKGS